MTEMSALATSVDDAVAVLDEGVRALRALRREYRAELEAVPDLNRRWREAEHAHADAVSHAAKTHRADLRGNDDPDVHAAADRAKEGSRDIADFARGRTQQVIQADFAALEEEVAEHTRTAGRSLHTTAWAPWTAWDAARGCRPG